MKNTILVILLAVSISITTSCNCNNQNKTDKKETVVTTTKQTKKCSVKENPKNNLDKRISLGLNSMQKNHQLKNMRSHLIAVQNIITLLSSEEYDKASKIAYKELGSTTEMKLMCASFGDKNFETLGLEFHKSADKMSEILKEKNKNKSLKALSNTMNYCVQCHSTYRQ